MRLPRLGSLLRSPALYGATLYALGGAGFAGANLILARVLEPVQFATFALALAVVNFSFPTSPLGIDGVILRRDLPIGRTLRRRVLLSTLIVATAAMLIGGLLYELSSIVLFVIFLAVLAGGANTVAAAAFQSRQRFSVSLPLAQSPNLVLLVVAVVAVTIGITEAWVPLALLAGISATVATVAWTAIRRTWYDDRSDGFSWGEPLAYAGAHAGLFLMVQLDRLIIPHVLELEELARYAVLAAVVGSAFRVLQLGVGHTLVPQMRAAPTVRARRKLLRHEAMIAGVILGAGSIALWYLTPMIVQLFVGDRYDLPPFLIFAALVAGTAKVLGAFAKAPVVALGSSADLLRLNLLGWVSVALAIAGGVVGARWGLAGLILGVSLGWWTWALVAGIMSLRHLTGGPTVPAPAAGVAAEQFAEGVVE